MTETQHSPKIETLINTVAIAATTLGVTLIGKRDWYGFFLIALALGLEYFKYWGRRTKKW